MIKIKKFFYTKEDLLKKSKIERCVIAFGFSFIFVFVGIGIFMLAPIVGKILELIVPICFQVIGVTCVIFGIYVCSWILSTFAEP